MEFLEFNKLLQKHVALMSKSDRLFVVETDKDALWELYLNSFPPGTNEIFRERREFDCSCCRHFVKSFGNVIQINGDSVVTIWDFETGDKVYQPVIDALAAHIRSREVSDVFVSENIIFGVEKSHELNEGEKVVTWEHMYIKLPSKFKHQSSETEATIRGQLRDSRNVFKRSLDEISLDAIESILELISQKSLYKGEEWESVLSTFLKLHKAYRKLDESKKGLFAWVKSLEVGGAISKIKNHSIGSLLTDITNGVDINEAVKKYEAMVAPSNYKRPKAIFTKKMIEDAQQTIIELGLTDSLLRRYAVLDDITINNIIFANKDVAKKLSGGVFDDLKNDLTTNPKNFDRVDEVSIEEFVKDILPRVSNIQTLLENKHEGNFVSLIAPVKKSPSLFKWDNGFSWAYNGNITDSMKARVKAAGGNVDGVLRFSLQWNDTQTNLNDFDAHCQEPNGNHIYFPNKTRRHPSSGMLDVDIIHPTENVVAVENIIYTDIDKMPDGKYLFYVHNYNHRGGRTGFSAEIEFNGQLHSFEYDKELRQNEEIRVAEVILRDGTFTIKSLISSSVSSRDIWGLKTNQFHPVSVLMFSPNYWDDQLGIGNKHYFFMLHQCVNATCPNGFFNEFLPESLMKHKRVFEALGSKMKVVESDDQLSGLGFSSTQRNSLICKIEGKVTRTLKVTF